MSIFLKVAKYKNGKTFLSIVEGYRDKNKKVKQRTIKKLGYLDKLKESFEDPISHFKLEVKKMKEKDEINIPSSVSKNEPLELDVMTLKT